MGISDMYVGATIILYAFITCWYQLVTQYKCIHNYEDYNNIIM